jgi:uncharacterized membrane protein
MIRFQSLILYLKLNRHLSLYFFSSIAPQPMTFMQMYFIRDGQSKKVSNSRNCVRNITFRGFLQDIFTGMNYTQLARFPYLSVPRFRVTGEGNPHFVSTIIRMVRSLILQIIYKIIIGIIRKAYRPMCKLRFPLSLSMD